MKTNNKKSLTKVRLFLMHRKEQILLFHPSRLLLRPLCYNTLLCIILPEYSCISAEFQTRERRASQFLPLRHLQSLCYVVPNAKTNLVFQNTENFLSITNTQFATSGDSSKYVHCVKLVIRIVNCNVHSNDFITNDKLITHSDTIKNSLH